MSRAVDRDALARIRDSLLDADYTVDGVAALLGPVAHGALARQETVPARRRTANRSPLESLVRLFLLQDPVAERDVVAALPLDTAVGLGLVERDGGEVRARLDVRPYDEAWYVVSDLGGGLDGRSQPLGADHVPGVGGASVTLAELTIRERVGRALDLGTGCGVQALHLSEHADRVTATDLSCRALEMAGLSAGLSGVPVPVLREGSFYEPVAGESFDLVVSNPPFVIGPSGRFAYRDAGLRGDAACEQMVAGAVDHLAPGGTFQCLANWICRDGEDWRERVRSWIPSGCDAWVVQRELQDPAQYVSLWLHDSGDIRGPRARELYDEWLTALEADRVEAIGFGWVVLRNAGAGRPDVRIEEWPHPIAQPLGPAVARHLEHAAWLRGHPDDTLLQARLTLAAGVVQETVGEPGAEDPAAIVLRQRRGMCRAQRVDTETAALVGASDGTVPVGALVDAVATLLEADAAALLSRLLPVVRRLVADGFLEPAA